MLPIGWFFGKGVIMKSVISGCMICLLSGIILADQQQIHPNCQVTEVTQVIDSTHFTCKVAGGLWGTASGSNPAAPLPGVRLRVEVRGVETLKANGDVSAGLKFVKSLLAGAESISLQNVQVRNYFRIIADVLIDGEDFGKRLVDNGFARMSYQKPAGEPIWTRPARPSTGEGQVVLSVSPQVQFSSIVAKHGWTDSAIKYQLGRVVDLSVFNPDMDFWQALEILRNSVDPPLPLVVLWRDLEENAFVDKDTAIGLDVDGSMPIGRALMLLLKSVGGEVGEIRYLVDGGVVTIATESLELQKKVVKIYDISELTSRPAGFMGGYGSMMGGYGSMMGGYGNSMGGYGSGTGNFGSSNNLYGNIIGNISGSQNRSGNRNMYNNNSFNNYNRPGWSR